MTREWRPAADPDVIRARARLTARVRAFFDQRGVTEVTTPVLSRASIPDPNIPSMSAQTAQGRRYLQTSPEFPMKRLLAAGSGDIFQICPVFRDGESGQWHNPEFELLEWYRLGLDELALARECASLVECVVERPTQLQETEFLSYRDAFVRHAGIDPLDASTEEIAETAIEILGTGGPKDWTASEWLDLLGATRVWPALGRGRVTVVTDFPQDQAALARLRPGNPPTAARFELFLDGIELANGFHELTDAGEQRARFEADNRRRRARGLPEVPLDECLLEALAHGLPDCAGVALGLDRLYALALGASSIAEVMSFPSDRA